MILRLAGAGIFATRDVSRTWLSTLQGHKPSAIVEKHYKRRPLDLLRMWHDKIEAWMLEQAGISSEVLSAWSVQYSQTPGIGLSSRADTSVLCYAPVRSSFSARRRHQSSPITPFL